MTFASLRALHSIIGEALEDMEQAYHTHRPKTVASDVEELYGDYDFEPTMRGSPSASRKTGHEPSRSVGSMTGISKAYVSPPPSPCVATYDQGRPLVFTSELLDFPSLDALCDPTSPAERLTVDPKVMAAINRIIAACGQMTATVQTPFLTICDSTMGYHLPSCMRVVEAAHIVEILRECGSEGLHIDILSERCGIEPSKLAHVLRLLATHHIFREIYPNVFATNRISSLMDSGKSLQELQEYKNSGRPELKYQGTNGIAAFVGLCADEINKSSAFMTETLLSNSSRIRRANEPTLAPFCFAFGTAHLGVDYFGWLEGEDIRITADDRFVVSGSQTGNGAFSPSDPQKIGGHHNRTQSSNTLPVRDGKAPNPNRFRLERFGKAMSGTGSWEAPGAVFNAFDWRSLPRGSIVIDVGGGIGSTSMLLASAFSSSEGEDLGLRFIIQDRSVVVGMGEKAWREKCPELLESGLATFQVHDFFTPQPIRNAAVFLLRVVLHDWPDDYARKILVHLREAATPDTKLLLADFILPLACAETMSSDSGLAGIEGSQKALPPAPLLPNLGKASANVYWMDMTMNAMFNSQERTLREIVALTRSAGWKVVRVTQAPGSLFGHIIAVPAPIRGPRQGSRSRKESITAILSQLGSSSIEQTKKRLGMSKESEDPDVGVSRTAPLRCNTPTFGSRTEVSSVKEALSRFGVGVKRYGGRAFGGSGTSNPSGSKVEIHERPTTKKRPSPLSVSPAYAPLTRTETNPPPFLPPPKREGSLRKAIRRHVSLVNLSRRTQEPEPIPAVPPLPEQLPSPVSPTYPPQSRLPRHSSHGHFRHSSISISSNLSGAPSFVPLPSSPDLIPQASTPHYHRHSNSTTTSFGQQAKPRPRCVSTIQLGQPHPLLMMDVGSRRSSGIGIGTRSPTDVLDPGLRKSRTGILRFDRPRRVDDSHSFSPEIGVSGGGGKMSSVFAVAQARIERGFNLRKAPQS